MNIPKSHAVVLRNARERNISLLPDAVETNRQLSENGTESQTSETPLANGTSRFARDGKYPNGVAKDVTPDPRPQTTLDTGRAILIIGEAGEILFARDKCDTIF